MSEDATYHMPDNDQYRGLAAQIAELVIRKQAQYGDAFGVSPKLLALLYPDGVRVEQYDDLLAVVRILDKLKRIATDRQGDGENPWEDCAGYCLLSLARQERERVRTQGVKWLTAP